MEPQTPKTNKAAYIGGGILVVLIIGTIAWFGAHRSPAFCFNFVHDTQFGDKAMEKSSNEGIVGPRGNIYYIPEVPALQTALKKEGFYIDPLEASGGKVYMAAFFGPSTKTAVSGFQKKYGIEETGEVDNATIDKLRELYGCKETAATSTIEYAATSTEVK